MDISTIKDDDIKRYIFYLMKHPGEIYKSIQSRKANRLNENAPYELSDKAIVKIRKEAVTVKNYFSFFHASEKTKESSFDLTLDLAGEKLDINMEQKIPWRIVFPDGESVAALHRFIWMQQFMTEAIARKEDVSVLGEYFVLTILDWIQEFIPTGKIENTENCHSEVWQTYSVAERVISWIYCLLMSTKKDIDNEKIVSAIKEQLLFIASHLEYYGETFTGNHLSNDGRALFIGGCVLQSKDLMEFGLQILDGESKRIFSDGIFLREGSSHYQLLITRNYTEALLFAQKYGNKAAEKKLKKLVKNLEEGCSFFLYKNYLGEWDIPRIGDISPDCTPQWLLGVPSVAAYLLENEEEIESPQTVGWHTLASFFNFDKQKKGRQTNRFWEEGVYCFQDWIRANIGDWILFAHINHIYHPYTLGHVHQDTGGIALFHRGKRIVIDTGRKKYLGIEQGGKGKEWFGHSMLNIDGRNPLMTSRGFYTVRYLTNMSGEAPEFIVEDNTIIIKNHGYERIKGVGCHQRRICIKEKTVEILDMVEGKGNHEITLLFHIPYHVGKNGADYEFRTEGDSYLVQPSQNVVDSRVIYGSDSMISTASDIYGTEYDISTIICKAFVQLPWEHKTVIRFEG